MTLWFVTLAVLGIPHIVHTQEILLALSPTHALAFVLEHPLIAFVAMGGVVLTITGAEALYAEMGHFGARAIRQSWYLLVLPALTLNYLGQGALILDDPASVANPFSGWRPRGRRSPCSCSPPWPRSSRPRRSSPAPTRCRAKRCVSASSRGCWSSTPPGRKPARSTCPSSTGSSRTGRPCPACRAEVPGAAEPGEEEPEHRRVVGLAP